MFLESAISRRALEKLAAQDSQLLIRREVGVFTRPIPIAVGGSLGEIADAKNHQASCLCIPVQKPT